MLLLQRDPKKEAKWMEEDWPRSLIGLAPKLVGSWKFRKCLKVLAEDLRNTGPMPEPFLCVMPQQSLLWHVLWAASVLSFTCHVACISVLVPGARECHCTHLTDEDTELQRVTGTCPKLHHRWVEELKWGVSARYCSPMPALLCAEETLPPLVLNIRMG